MIQFATSNWLYLSAPSDVVWALAQLTFYDRFGKIILKVVVFEENSPGSNSTTDIFTAYFENEKFTILVVKCQIYI